MGWNGDGCKNGCAGYGMGSLLAGFAIVGAGACLFAGPAYAIPSPELVIGSISSLSQLFAVGAAVLGGGAVAAGVKANSQAAGGRGARRLAMLFLAAFLLSLGALGYLYKTHSDERLARLQATLLRPATMPGTKILAKDLKELSFSGQSRHRLGITTAEAAALLRGGAEGGEAAPLFLDIRETAENETGTLPGARHVRYPDLPSAGLSLTGRTVILFCHNGNRSSETCEKLAARGIDCRFIVGGIEKWIVEGRPFTDPKVRSLSDLRAVPHYPGHDVLLDTPQVHALRNEEGAIFVDVRYPDEYALQHLPGAINIPLRRTPTAELKRMIAALPKKPIIAACYDRRGCFAAQVLGLELTRAGHDFRGRYTLPWEYYIAPPPKPHVQAWLAAQNEGLWSKAVGLVAGWLAALAEKTGLLAAIFLLALASRLIVLPVALKAERDQMVTRAAAAQLADLKARLRHDPERYSRALRAFYRRQGLTPGRNLLALVFLPLMAVILSAVQRVVDKAAADGQPYGLLWFKNAAEPDPSFMLPLLVGALGAVYMHVALARTRRHRFYVWGLGLPAIAALTAWLSVAGNIYVALALLLLLAQRALVLGWHRKIAVVGRALSAVRRKLATWRGVVPLRYPQALATCGNKALRLAEMRQAGIPVPDGVVLTQDFISRLLHKPAARRRRILDRVWRRSGAGAGAVAVRSSARAEDGGQNSFAGVFETVLDVRRDGFAAAVEQVAASFSADRVKSYGGETGGGNILVQHMVAADYSGVLFTRDPEAFGLMRIELVEGTAERLVSGLVTPRSYRAGRLSHKLHERHDDQAPPIDLAPLLAIARQVEALFGRPQDIEWTYANGRFAIVQSRDITTVAEVAAPEVAAEWQRLLSRAADARPGELLFEQDEMSEVLPQPTPLSLSLMQALWAPGGSVDLACRRLGLVYPVEEDGVPRLTTLFGRLYTDARCARQTAVRLGPLAARRLRRRGEAIADAYEKDFLPDFCRRMGLMAAVDFDALSLERLHGLVLETVADFVTHSHAEVEVINIAASFYMDEARQALVAAGQDPAKWLAAAGDAGPARTLAEAAQRPASERAALLLEQLGHRAVFDYELSQPRNWEDPDRLQALAAAAGSGDKANAEDGANARDGADGGADVRREATAQPLSTLPEAVGEAVARARRFQSLKEDAKHQVLRQLDILRRAVMALDRKLNLAGLSFYLTTEELHDVLDAAAGQVPEALRQRAKARLARASLLMAQPALPARLAVEDLERATMAGQGQDSAAMGGLVGKRVAGQGIAEGRACLVPDDVAERGGEIAGFADGDILVCRMVHPAWLPVVLRAGGVVCEVGGWLSHMAIVAREHDVPMIVGVSGLGAIPAGAPLRLHQDGTVEVVTSEAAPLRAAE